MSGVFGVFGRTTSDDAQRTIAAAIQGGLHARGSESRAVWTDTHALLGGVGSEWEEKLGAGSAATVAHRGGVAVVADASLYYLADLRRALRSAGIDDVPPSATAAEWIAAAYAAWGEDCAARIEGDFAFVLWDAPHRRVLCARDPTGTRPLFHAAIGDVLVVASTISAVLAFPGCPRDLNLPAVARAAAGLFAVTDGTAYAAVSTLPAGHRLTASGGAIRVERFWSPPSFGERTPTLPFEAAAAELRELIGDAVEQRLSATGPTSVWLSGGYDSTAVFAAGNARLDQHGTGARLRPVSVSYPPLDPGREDESITAAAVRWSAPVHWLDIADVPLLDRAAARAAAREDPFAHAFETWNAALARGSRDVGARVALTGVGGDHLFQVSAIFLADLARRGHWLRAWREWRARNPDAGVRTLWPWVTGRAEYLRRSAPPWIDPHFARAHALVEDERRHTPARTRLGHAAYESHWLLAYGYRERVMAALFEIGLSHGVEIRSPLFDERVIRFAATRPVEERASGGETKRLLRRSMAGLLPAELLAARRARTGTMGDYLDRSLRGPFADELTRVLRDPALAALGVVEPHVLRQSCTDYLAGRAPAFGGPLLTTLHTELWLRSRIDLRHRPAPSGSAVALAAATLE